MHSEKRKQPNDAVDMAIEKELYVPDHCDFSGRAFFLGEATGKAGFEFYVSLPKYDLRGKVDSLRVLRKNILLWNQKFGRRISESWNWNFIEL